MSDNDGARFRIVSVAHHVEERPVVFMRLFELRSDGIWYDTSPYGPLVMEIENFHEFSILMEMGARATRGSIQHIKWDKEPFNDEVSRQTSTSR